MKKKDIIQLVKESIKETRAFYGSHDNFQPTGQRRNLSGYPGVMDEEMTALGYPKGFIPTADKFHQELVGRDMTEAELKGMVNEFGEEAKNEIGRKEFVSMVKDVRRRRKSVMTEGLPGQGVSLDDVALVQSGDDSEEAEGGIMI